MMLIKVLFWNFQFPIFKDFYPRKKNQILNVILTFHGYSTAHLIVVLDFQVYGFLLVLIGVKYDLDYFFMTYVIQHQI